MSNVLAIAHKELRSYFASPIAYIVIGFFALLFGWFYIGILDWFVRQGLQMARWAWAASAMNVNQQMIRPLILNMTVVFLFLLPLITMRTYAEEKRSGTIELLLTSPLTDLEIVLGKFLGALGAVRRDGGGDADPLRAAVRVRQAGMEAAGHRVSRPAALRRLLHRARACSSRASRRTRSSPARRRSACSCCSGSSTGSARAWARPGRRFSSTCR